MGLHVLVVARWYPAFDNPGRGSFVADHVLALAAAGVRTTVASFEPIPIRGDEGGRAERRRAAAAVLGAAIDAGVRGGWATATPRRWGARDVPVARLPVIADQARRGAADTVDAHAAALLPFGLALAERDPFDLVHAHTGMPDGISAARLADRLGVPLLVTEHSSTIGTELAGEDARRLYRGLVAPSRRVVAVSASLGAEVAALIGADRSAIGELPNAVPVDRFLLPNAEGRDPNELLYVAARRATKGIETGLRALAIVRAQRPAVHLRLIGPAGLDEDESRWAALVDELGLADAVRFEGPHDRDAVADAMRRAAVFVHPSSHETFGMVAAEALASGLPVAATPSGGVDAIVGTDGRFGALADDASPEALARAVLEVIDRRGSFDGAAMRQSVVERFSPEAVARRTIELYDALLQERRASAQGARTNQAPEGTGGSAAHARGVRSAAGRAPAAFVAGFGRTLTVDRVGDLPEGVRANLVVATRGKPGVGPAAPAVGRWLQVDLDGEYARQLAALRRPGGSGLVERIVGTVRRPRAWIRRRRMLRDPDGSKRRIFAEFLRDAGQAARELASPRDVPPIVLIVPIEADDALTIESVVGGATATKARTGAIASVLDRLRRRTPGLAIAPGTLRWLVDRTGPGSGEAD